jgi:hypothetical protein
MAPRLSETTVAAPQTLNLRECVNAERGRDNALQCALNHAAKVGNATTIHGMRTGSRERLGGAKHDGPRLGVEHDIAHRDEGYTS